MQTWTRRAPATSREARSETCADRLRTRRLFPTCSTRQGTARRWPTRQTPGQRLRAARVGLRCRLLCRRPQG